MKKKAPIKITRLCLSLFYICLALGAAVRPATAADFLTITVENGKRQNVKIKVPKDPKRIAALDYVAVDTLLSLGLGDRIIGIPKSTPPPPYLHKLFVNGEISNLGTLKEIDMEALMSLEPDVIFTSGRLRSRYHEFTFIAPTIMSEIDYKLGAWESFVNIAKRNSYIFGMENEIDDILGSYKKRIAALKLKTDGKTAVICIVSGGNLSTLGNYSRCSLIGNEIGFDNVAKNINSTHGNSSSFELLVDLDPDYIFVLDRDMALNNRGGSPAKKLLDNELVHQTRAYKNNQIIFLTPAPWYIAEGGIKAMDIMLSDIESAFK
jgi:iron complex transport system substrate-binding protein